ncbi:hypothetical protein [Demequina mangrovi]|uniref:Sulfotransferase family protein n=1 Tax=Demequina mangrovi TaxID=1043493 RepID=A0A1H6YFR1_9MICO|nr:hypothetical protein [Demequina mangrovi]SEJ40128.1 hypothetical protein SAMN05421637_1722 [Demequina mangrovi]
MSPESTRNRDYSLTWFVHFRKAGGTSLAQLAEINGERLPAHHRGANPVDTDGRFERVWELSPEGLSALVDTYEASGVTFVATEWGMPALDTLIADPRVRLVTLIRDPIARMTSNYTYDHFLGDTRARSIRGYCADRSHGHTQHNYYSRMLLRERWATDVAPAESARQALAVLDGFDVVQVLEAPNAMGAVADALGWASGDLHANSAAHQRSTVARRAFTQLRRKRPELLLRALAPVGVADADRAWLVDRNQADVQVYGSLLSSSEARVESEASRL